MYRRQSWSGGNWVTWRTSTLITLTCALRNAIMMHDTWRLSSLWTSAPWATSSCTTSTKPPVHRQTHRHTYRPHTDTPANHTQTDSELPAVVPPRQNHLYTDRHTDTLQTTHRQTVSKLYHLDKTTCTQTDMHINSQIQTHAGIHIDTSTDHTQTQIETQRETPTGHRPTQPSIPLGSVYEYQLRLGRQRQVWFIPLTAECGVCR